MMEVPRILWNWFKRITKLGVAMYRKPFRKDYEPIGRTSSFMPADTIVFRDGCDVFCGLPLTIYAVRVDEEEGRGYELAYYMLIGVREIDEDIADLKEAIDWFRAEMEVRAKEIRKCLKGDKHGE